MQPLLCVHTRPSALDLEIISLKLVDCFLEKQMNEPSLLYAFCGVEPLKSTLSHSCLIIL
jgi:hypothetical protein